MWFSDLEIAGFEVFGRPSLERLLRSTCLKYKTKYLPDRLITDIMQAVLTGEKLPYSVMEALLNRIRTDKGKVSYNRASLLKAFLNRKFRIEGEHDMELQTVLDEDNSQPGYILGRLFSVFERLQEEAHRSNLSTTIASRFYAGANIRPQTVFSSLFQLHIHHLRKLKNPGREINFRKMIGELMQKINRIPTHLSSEQQSLFAIGYYHQRQSFYNSNKNDKTVNATEEDANEFE